VLEWCHVEPARDFLCYAPTARPGILPGRMDAAGCLQSIHSGSDADRDASAYGYAGANRHPECDAFTHRDADHCA